MSTTMVRRWVLAGGAWLLSVAVATAVATGAVGSMRQGIFGSSDAPYSEAKVDALLAASSTGPSAGPSSAVPGSAAPSASASAAPSASASASGGSGVVRALTTAGGTIVAVCEAGLVTLKSWTPNPGFVAEHVQRGPAAVASLRFKARSGGGDVRAQVTCTGDEPGLTIED